MIPFPTVTHQRDVWINNVNRVEAGDRTDKDTIGGKPVEIQHRKGHKWHPMGGGIYSSSEQIYQVFKARWNGLGGVSG